MTAPTAVLDRAPGRPSLPTRQEPPPSTPAPAQPHDLVAARASGQQPAATPGLAERPWEDVAPLLGAGWACRHAELCPTPDRHGWRVSSPAVQEGWALGHTRPYEEHVS